MRFARCLVLVVVTLLLPGLARAGLAMLTDLQGRVLDGRSGAPLALLAELREGASLRLEAGARASLLYLAGGAEFLLGGPGEFVVGPQEVLARSGTVSRRNLPVRLQPVRGAAERMAQGTLVTRAARSGTQLRLLSPTGAILPEPRPALRWESIPGARRYRVQVLDVQGVPLLSEEVADTSFTLPVSVPLRDGTAYTWGVEARVGGRLYANWAEFGLVTAAQRAEVDAARPRPGASFSERVAYALKLEDLQLREAARARWQELAAERPEDARLRALAAE